MIGAGTVINPIIKIVTTVAILGAAYLFIVKPVLDTTEDVVREGTAQFQQSQTATIQRSDDIALSSARSSAESYVTSLQNSWPAAAREIKGCVRDAGQDAREMEGCRQLGLTLAHTVQSDHNFATSYAESLDAQGRAADADRVRDCVDEAGFKVGAMERCRALADRLLFG